jgi:hypothetical protein
MKPIHAKIYEHFFGKENQWFAWFAGNIIDVIISINKVALT